MVTHEDDVFAILKNLCFTDYKQLVFRSDSELQVLLTQCVSVSTNAIKKKNAVEVPSSRMLRRNRNEKKQNLRGGVVVRASASQSVD